MAELKAGPRARLKSSQVGNQTQAPRARIFKREWGPGIDSKE
jgi:hypothetical protein